MTASNARDKPVRWACSSPSLWGRQGGTQGAVLPLLLSHVRPTLHPSLRTFPSFSDGLVSITLIHLKTFVSACVLRHSLDCCLCRGVTSSWTCNFFEGTTAIIIMMMIMTLIHLKCLIKDSTQNKKKKLQTDIL